MDILQDRLKSGNCSWTQSTIGYKWLYFYFTGIATVTGCIESRAAKICDNSAVRTLKMKTVQRVH